MSVPTGSSDMNRDREAPSSTPAVALASYHDTLTNQMRYDRKTFMDLFGESRVHNAMTRKRDVARSIVDLML